MSLIARRELPHATGNAGRSGRRLHRAALAAWAALTIVAAPAHADGWTVPEGVKTVVVEGYPLAYAEAGQGVPIVVVHGAWVDQRLFKGQLEAFSRTHRVIVPSLRHHWPEPWNGEGTDYSVEQHARDIVAMVRALNLGKVHLLGHSRGGGVAAAAARLAPDTIRTLILAEPFGLAEVATDPTAVRQRMDGAAGLAVGLRSALQAGKPRAEVAERGWESANGTGSWARTPPAVQQMIVDNVATMAVPAQGPATPIATCDDVGRFAFPVLLLQSASAAKLYVDTHDGLRRCNAAIPPAVVIPASTHNMHVSNAEAFNSAVLEFIRSR